MDTLISMYIDNELDLYEKVLFIDRIHSQQPFFRETHALLQQEQLLRIPPDTTVLPKRPPLPTGGVPWFRTILRPLIYVAAGFAAASLLFFNLTTNATITPPSINRFIIYDPAAHQVELTGSFTGWQRTTMQPVGNSGYWELILQVPAGEHRFAYILDGSRQIADPTLSDREKDDFGGENSILKVGGQV